MAFHYRDHISRNGNSCIIYWYTCPLFPLNTSHAEHQQRQQPRISQVYVWLTLDTYPTPAGDVAEMNHTKCTNTLDEFHHSPLDPSLGRVLCPLNHWYFCGQLCWTLWGLHTQAVQLLKYSHMYNGFVESHAIYRARIGNIIQLYTIVMILQFFKSLL